MNAKPVTRIRKFLAAGSLIASLAAPSVGSVALLSQAGVHLTATASGDAPTTNGWG